MRKKNSGSNANSNNSSNSKIKMKTQGQRLKNLRLASLWARRKIRPLQSASTSIRLLQKLPLTGQSAKSTLTNICQRLEGPSVTLQISMILLESTRRFWGGTLATILLSSCELTAHFTTAVILSLMAINQHKSPRKCTSRKRATSIKS